MSRSRTNRKKRRFGEGEDISPLNGLSNLSDAMLVLALGILVALVVHWNVDIVPAADQVSPETQMSQESGQDQVDTSGATEFSENDLQKAGADEAGSGEGLERMGTVYYDEVTGKYYVVDDEDDTAADENSSQTPDNPENRSGNGTDGQ